MKKIHPWHQDPTINEIFVNTNIDPKLTIVMPVFNQSKIIENILNQLFNSIELPFDLIIINDASDDNSSEIVCSFLRNTNFTKIVNATLIENYFSIYETACDNLGFKMARTEYILEFQSDIYINHKGFEKKMIDAIEQFNLSSVSGRLVHHYSVLEGPKAWFKYPLKKLQFNFNLINEGIGLMGHKIFQNKQSNLPDNFIYIGETVARGPWLLKKSILEKLNYLDQENYFLGNDDHDFHFRARKLINADCAYFPVNIYSNRLEGSTRKIREGTNAKIYDYLNQTKTGSEDFKHFMKFYKPFKKIVQIEF
jgi:glycosyltransferase involved in cell wall biosynthesis